MQKNRFFGLSKNVFITGLVSFFMDMSSEMVYPLVPLFLANVLGINKSLIGLVEGIAESTASMVRIFSGFLSDRTGNRKWFMVAGYATATISRPIIAIASTWHHVLGSRFIDRLGKGIRTSPRDAIIADSTETAFLGRAFSFHRAMDTMGAVIGPALAFLFLGLFHNNYRRIFWISMIPGLIAVFLIIFFIKEKNPTHASLPRHKPKLTLKHFDWRFKLFLLITGLFAIGNSSDVFLILRAQQTGIPAVLIPIVYLLFNLIYSLTAVPAGIVADHFGKKRVILAGFLLFAFVYYGFAVSTSSSAIWILFSLYGIFMGLTEGILKAFLTTLIPSDFKATAYGIYHSVIGIAILPASLIGGWLWDNISPSATFYFGSITALLSALLFIVFILFLGKPGKY